MSDETVQKTDAEVIRDLTLQGFPRTFPQRVMLGATPFAVIPDDCHAESMEKFMPSPSRVRQKLEMHTVDAFINYWRDFKMPQSVVLANQDAMRFVAIFDYHSGSEMECAGNCDHQITYKCPVSQEWKLWLERDKKRMSQTDFAQFIEDNIEDICQVGTKSPSGAQMLEVATGLEVRNNVQFKSSKRLDNGEVQLTYNEDVQGTDRTGQMNIPQEFYLGIPVFKKGVRYEVKARLRYRMGSGSIRFWYDLYRTDRVLDDAFGNVYDTIMEVVEPTSMYMASVSGG